MDEAFERVGFSPARILLPRAAELEKWAVVACDQFTAEPDYWARVERTVGGAPSALRLILPEARLKAPDVDARIARINETMARYLADGVFAECGDAMIYVERGQSDGTVRRGLIGKIDLEAYDFTPGSGALIRATEGTVLDRIPPRVRVRRGAPLELPHVLLLLDDPGRTVIEPLTGETAGMEKLYDFELMEHGGHLRGYRLSAAQQRRAAAALARLGTEEAMREKYGVDGAAPLLFAVGDGNHSLAAAKACYEEQKAAGEANPPARYALVEVVNNRDDALRFAPIHRVLFGVDAARCLAAFRACYPNAYEGRGEGHVIEAVSAAGSLYLTVPDPKSQLAAGTLQTFLDGYLAGHGGELDYIHGDGTARALGAAPGNLAFLLPAMGKEQLFRTVMQDGVLPRKTFSMGQPSDKRYYLEARRIR